HQPATLSAANVSQQDDTITGELMQVQALATILAGNLRMRGELGPGRFQLADFGVEQPDMSEPIVDVPAPIPPRHASSAADGEIDLPSALVEFFGNLGSGLPRPDYQNGACRQRRRVLIINRVNLQNAWRNGHAKSWNLR